MQLRDVLRLLLLSAIWGFSFIFMRVIAPVLGPVLTAELRVMLAGIALTLYFGLIRFPVGWKEHWRQYLIIGTINSALPFLLFSFAAQHIPAAYSIIFNASAPLFGAIFGVIWLGESFSFSKGLGLLLGLAGVALVSRAGLSTAFSQWFGWAMAACLVASMCYGLAGVYLKRFAQHIKPMGIAAGSQIAAGLVLLPLVPFAPPTGPFTAVIGLNVLGLSLLCSAVAYLFYFQLIADIGPTKALTVTFLVPVFGLLWGALFLGEAVTVSMLLGCGLVLLGTMLVLRRS
ncbi:DMT family transporter [Thermostichus vulcanus]|uniref:DMT family transporter n=1 Tax=Thermostichus vulcanus str. 'Rupite' TaxID=2813851 RepID=A0ABT0C952_THEVL|nr:DMT family transporter [Thermostichus vulcanus]MCJ2542295.1 DMT family transporter [Thermostichus vulcanus str. 'Rupite']